MKALILNSGIGKRMGALTHKTPKCMVPIGRGYTILSWQLKILKDIGIREAVITTGPFDDVLRAYAGALTDRPELIYVHNARYDTTNYIYSIFCAKEHLQSDDIILLHGDLVLDPSVLKELAQKSESSVAVDSTLPLPDKDFKAELSEGRVTAIGIDRFSEGCVACQPAYMLRKDAFSIWLYEITHFCESGDVKVYAENALNVCTDRVALWPMELHGRLCNEIDSEQDLMEVSARFLRVLSSTPPQA